MANNPNLPISTGNLNEYHTRVIGNLSQTGITGQTVAAQLYALNSSQQPKTMTAKFNLSDSNPATWGEYIDDAVGMTAGSDVWDAFFGIKPVMIKNGAIVGELDPSQGYAKYKDGTTADITTGADGDVMIYIPRRDLHIWVDSGYGYVSMTEDLGKTGYTHYAHTYKGNDCDYFAIGRYKGYYDGSKLRSLSGKTPTGGTGFTIGDVRTYAQANGTGYEQSAFFQLTYRQAMYMLKYLGQNAQTAVGRGYVDSNNSAHITGGTDSLGMDYGENTGKVQMSLFGIEDFWGNLYEYIDGVSSSSARKLFAIDGNYNDAGTGYNDTGASSFSSNVTGYMKDANWTDLAGFTPASQTYGSSSTYFCDNAVINASSTPNFGGSWDNGDNAGVFRFNCSNTTSAAGASRGCRLMYIHAAA